MSKKYRLGLWGSHAVKCKRDCYLCCSCFLSLSCRSFFSLLPTELQLLPVPVQQNAPDPGLQLFLPVLELMLQTPQYNSSVLDLHKPVRPELQLSAVSGFSYLLSLKSSGHLFLSCRSSKSLMWQIPVSLAYHNSCHTTAITTKITDSCAAGIPFCFHYWHPA